MVGSELAGAWASENRAGAGRREHSCPEGTGATEDEPQRRFAAAAKLRRCSHGLQPADSDQGRAKSESTIIMNPLRSLRVRLIVVFVTVVATAMGVLFLYVVPSLRADLISDRLGRLQTIAGTSAQVTSAGAMFAKGVPRTSSACSPSRGGCEDGGGRELTAEPVLQPASDRIWSSAASSTTAAGVGLGPADPVLRRAQLSETSSRPNPVAGSGRVPHVRADAAEKRVRRRAVVASGSPTSTRPPRWSSASS